MTYLEDTKINNRFRITETNYAFFKYQISTFFNLH